jgi:hypothetical protein
MSDTPDKLSQFSADMFGRCIQAMLWSNQIETFSPGEGWVENAVVGLFYRPEDEFAAAVVGEADRRASAAREFFRIHGPADMQPLPTTYDDCQKLEGVGGRMGLLGIYARAVYGSVYDYTQHAKPYDFFCGVMAIRNTPDNIRRDRDLQKEFPPKRIPGMLSEMEQWCLQNSARIESEKAAERELRAKFEQRDHKPIA